MKTKVEINNNIYNKKAKDSFIKKEIGLTEEIVRNISREKQEPDWVLEIRLKALEYYEKLPMPTWGPDLSELKLDEIATYVKPGWQMADKWEDVPEEIKDVFDDLGIPEAEKKALSGVGAQFDSEMVYHRIQDKLSEQGVI